MYRHLDVVEVEFECFEVREVVEDVGGDVRDGRVRDLQEMRGLTLHARSARGVGC